MREYFYSKTTQNYLIMLIVVNAITIGMQTFPAVEKSIGFWLTILDNV